MVSADGFGPPMGEAGGMLLLPGADAGIATHPAGRWLST